MKCPSTTRRQFVLTALLLTNLFFLGCSGTLDGGGENNPPQPPDKGFGNILQVGDLVKVEFSGTPEVIAPHEEHIKDDGTITLNLIGSIRAAGKTPGILQRDIQAAYVPRYYRQLTVTVKGADLFYYVGGEVRTPGRQLYLGPITVTGAIKSAGDFTDFAKKKEVKLKRGNGRVYTINAENPDSDAQVFPGDSITVLRRLW
jgi:protein involved in polysaccharide export with SLBB domain